MFAAGIGATDNRAIENRFQLFAATEDIFQNGGRSDGVPGFVSTSVNSHFVSGVAFWQILQRKPSGDRLFWETIGIEIEGTFEVVPVQNLQQGVVFGGSVIVGERNGLPQMVWKGWAKDLVFLQLEHLDAIGLRVG